MVLRYCGLFRLDLLRARNIYEGLAKYAEGAKERFVNLTQWMASRTFSFIRASWCRCFGLMVLPYCGFFRLNLLLPEIHMGSRRVSGELLRRSWPLDPCKFRRPWHPKSISLSSWMIFIWTFIIIPYY